MNTIVTSHAAERYIERHAPTLSLEEATAELSAFAVEAVRLREKTEQGHSVWQAGEVLFVTKFDNGERVVVTVLPKSSNRTIDVLGDAALLEESEADRAEMHALIAAEKKKSKPVPVTQSPLFQITVLTKKNLAQLANLRREKAATPDMEKQLALSIEKTNRQQLSIEMQKERMEQKTKRIVDHNETSSLRLKNALRIAVRLLISGEGDLKDIGEDFLTPKFWDRK